ncbi:EamA family transporter [Roseobacter sp. HKCCD9010]|uniref:DMT family transporter n=1 Tax=unclassified Roseobacter TaxID=196798 RepID=UPI00149251D9|nr:EamA family transporter [Rhodobacterales bacterium HKCCD4356]NNV14478.1 EamA family transporter [Roseobacter sp. HKCCD7357]NNV18749.1 EamA family transporter [Roseobacter sp. HKCCD8768]NNV28188.1 EamA family transporter [Roseobacter sp. HKCCD8192]NNV31921.1 EamA family transporter [Roseobacter sp. HKCCD9061]NNV36730.1 EamA family transporter [Roseobacter sp. HKCCD9073]NNV40989.1 EamA family transporter [Roseobacter sp. HKCCD9054]NNV45224.1 EamA family transporter [Roseobacter sp. HKCCD649
MFSAGIDKRRANSWVFSLLIAVFAVWGAQQVAIKIGNEELSPIYQAALRSIVAATLMTIWFLIRGTPPWKMGVSMWQAAALGALFSLDFALLFVGLDLTTASRGTILYYTAPIMIAAGTALILPEERIGRIGTIGLATAFAGVALVLWRGNSGHDGNFTGDLFALGAAAAWAVTILLIKTTSLIHVPASAALYFQLLGSAVLLPILSLALGETWIVPQQVDTYWALGFQSFLVAFASYLIFFWVLKQYSASKLSAYSFLAPIFGVMFSWKILGDEITPAFLGGSVMVIAGLVLVTKDEGAS